MKQFWRESRGMVIHTIGHTVIVPSENSICLISRSLAPLVSVVQAADLGDRDDATGMAIQD